MTTATPTAQAVPAIKVGLTGGIGCGKSAVTKFFQEKGIPIIDADRIGKELVELSHNNKPSVLSDIVKLFGKSILLADKSLDRSALRDIVFSNKNKLKQLEAIIHPAIKQEIQKQIADSAYNHHYIIVDVPLLVEKEYQTLFDQIVVVDCLPEQQLSRVKARDKSTIKQVQAIISSQANRQQRLLIADEVLDNTGSLDKLREQVNNYHNKLCLLTNYTSLK